MSSEQNRQDKRSEVAAAISAFWKNYDDPQIEAVAQAMASAIAAELPDAFARFGAGLLAYASCLQAGNCNFWLDFEKSRAPALEELESRLSEENVRYHELRQLMHKWLETYPWNPRWLIPDLLPAGNVQDAFADALLRMGGYDDETLERLVADFYGSRENARVHMLDSFIRGMRLMTPYEQMLMKEERAQPPHPLPDEDGSPEAVDALMKRQWGEENRAEEDVLISSAYGDRIELSEHVSYFTQYPLFLTGPYQPGLVDNLNLHSLAVLKAFARRHEVVGGDEMDRRQLLAVLKKVIPRDLLRDIHYLDNRRYSALLRLSDLNGELYNMANFRELRSLLRDGYVFGYRRCGGVRLFLPAELSQVIHGHSFEQRLIQNNLNLRLWMLLNVMSNLYGVFTLDQFEAAALNIYEQTFVGRTRAEVREHLRVAMLLYGRDDQMKYQPPYFFNGRLTLKGATRIWQEGELFRRAFRPLETHILDMYGERFYNPDDRLFIKLSDFVTALLPEAVQSAASPVMDTIAVFVVSDQSPDRLLAQLEAYGIRYDREHTKEDLIRLLADYSNNTIHWSLRGYSPHELSEAHNYLPS